MSAGDCEKMKEYLTGTNGHQIEYLKAMEYLQKAIDSGDSLCKEKYYEILVEKKSFGKSFDERIFIMEDSGIEGVGMEYMLLEKIYGEKGTGYSLEKQTVQNKEGRWLDLMSIKLPTGENITYYFDITHFFGK
jgi:hypothetical protein